MIGARLLPPLAFATSLLGAAASRDAQAEEGLSGHYIPGTVSDFADSAPPEKAIALRAFGFTYTGTNNQDAFPVAGLIATNVRSTTWSFGLTAAVRPEYDLVGKLGWSASITIPFVILSIDANVTHPDGFTRAQSETITGIGDVVVTPIMLIYPLRPDLSVTTRLALYLPTGKYQTGRLANTGKNYYTIEPILGVVYFSPDNGIEAALHAALGLNTENKSTSYHTGTQTHAEGTLAWHVPAVGGLVGAGGTGFWYQQIVGDSGLGATQGPFEARSMGAGPVVSYITKIRRQIPLSFDLKWMREFAVQRRLDGQLWFLKIVGSF